MKLSQVRFEDVRMTTIDGLTVKVLLRGERELKFLYDSEAELRADLALWIGDRSASEISNLPPFDFMPPRKSNS